MSHAIRHASQGRDREGLTAVMGAASSILKVYSDKPSGQESGISLGKLRLAKNQRFLA